MQSWPTTLPLPSTESYSINPQSSVIRTNMEAGPAKYRKRFTAVPYDVTAQFLMTPAQMAIFKTFYNTTINLGADWFIFNGLDLGNGYATNSEVHIVGEPQEVKMDGLWRVSLKLEVRNA
ncbi:MAG TPA: hypothetical protein DCO68_10165 [Methylophilaceae bacterium]|nr:hypothetical protein [Methylophilaceae bacterium]